MVNPLLMGSNTENGATRQELLEKSPISERRKKKLLEIEREESKKLNNFKKTTETKPSVNRCRRARAVQVEEKVFSRKQFKNYRYLKLLVPYHDNPSGKAICESI